MDLLLAPFGAGVVLVEAGEIAIVTLVERLSRITSRSVWPMP
jgi:hypothetical protein